MHLSVANVTDINKETGRRIGKRIDEHLTTDKKYNVYKHMSKAGHFIS